MRMSRGFTLFETLMILPILGIALVVAGQVFSAAMMSVTRNRQFLQQAPQLDAAILQLRCDAWVAQSWTVTPEGALTLTDAAGRQVRWQTDAERHWLRREQEHVEASAPARQAFGQPTDQLRFSTQAGRLVVELDQTPRAPLRWVLTMPLRQGEDQP